MMGDVGTGDQQHASAWYRADPSRVGNALDATPGILPPEDMGDMFFPHSLDSQNPHINAASYYASPAAARAVHSYRPSPHGKSFFLLYQFFTYFNRSQLTAKVLEIGR